MMLWPVTLIAARGLKTLGDGGFVGQAVEETPAANKPLVRLEVIQ